MMVHRCSLGLVVSAAAITGLAGCIALPVNYMRMDGSRALDLVGRYPKAVEFDRGEFVRWDGGGSAIMTGPRTALLFDYGGVGNRFELLIRQGDQTVLYRRLDQRGPLSGAGRRIRQTAGVRIDRQDDKLGGLFDVMLARVDLRGYGPAFEHYPKHVRVRVKFALPCCREPAGPTSRPTRFWPCHAPDGPQTSGLGDVDPRWLFGRFAPDLPALNVLRLPFVGKAW